MKRFAVSAFVWGVWLGALLVLRPWHVSSNAEFARRAFPLLIITGILRLAQPFLLRWVEMRWNRPEGETTTDSESEPKRSLFRYLSLGGLLGAGFLLVGSLQLIYWVTESSRALLTETWHTTTGTIQDSFVRKEVNGRRVAYYPDIRYSYEVDGAQFVGSRIWLTKFATTAGDAQRTVQGFPKASRALVYFDKGDPKQSLLRPGLSSYSYIWLGLCGLALLVGAWLLWRTGQQ
jgi:Protein of unknown function (DUF3592)